MSKETDKESFVNNFIDENSTFSNGLRIPRMFKVDTEKIQELRDVRLIFEAIEISFSEDHIMFGKIKHLLEEDGD